MKNNSRRWICYPIPVDESALLAYGRNINLSCVESAFKALVNAISYSSFFKDKPSLFILARQEPRPVIAIAGNISDGDLASLQIQAKYLNWVCANLRHINYVEAEILCKNLADTLVTTYGKDEIKNFHFTAIPRGGFIVLSLLAYCLGLSRSQLEGPYSDNRPLVVVDDCSISGARFGSFLAHYTNQQIIFAHLCSHPELRAAIQLQEPRVIACFSAFDLQDFLPLELDKEQMFQRLGGRRYWMGRPEHITFSWNEPDRIFWNPVTEKVESIWHIVPPDYCVKNRLSHGEETAPVQVQHQGKGPLRHSATTVYGKIDGKILIGSLESKKSFVLEDVSASMWDAIVIHGDLESAVADLLKEYDVEEETLRLDLSAFVDDLITHGLLEIVR